MLPPGWGSSVSGFLAKKRKEKTLFFRGWEEFYSYSFRLTSFQLVSRSLEPYSSELFSCSILRFLLCSSSTSEELDPAARWNSQRPGKARAKSDR